MLLDCKMKNLGTDYMGTKSTTNSGIPCQRWDMQHPHKHGHNHVNRFPDITLSDASNFCRNPDQRSAGPWCFTTDPDVKWEPCDIPLCSGRWNYYYFNTLQFIFWKSTQDLLLFNITFIQLYYYYSVSLLVAAFHNKTPFISANQQ